MFNKGKEASLLAFLINQGLQFAAHLVPQTLMYNNETFLVSKLDLEQFSHCAVF